MGKKAQPTNTTGATHEIAFSLSLSLSVPPLMRASGGNQGVPWALLVVSQKE